MRRFLLDNDGSNIFYNLGSDVTAAIMEAVKECPPEVTTYLLCSGAGTCYYPTRVGDVNPRCTGLLDAHSRGEDPFGSLLRGLKASGKEVFITCRMNDVHDPTDTWNLPRVRREHPDCIVGMDEVRRGKATWLSYCMDYANPVVRHYSLALIREQAELYGEAIHGLQLDWMRFPRHLSGSPEEVWAKRYFLTSFVADVREMLHRIRPGILLCARVPTTPAGCRNMGIDLAKWGAHGLIDLLVACPFLTTEWRIPVAALRSELGTSAIPVYAGCDFGFGRQSHHPESLHGLCTSLYDCGADGIYLFNFPCWIEYLAARPYHWLAGLDHPQTAAMKPLHLAIDHRQHRQPGTDQPARLPAGLAPGESLTLSLYLPAAAFPFWRTLLLVHSHGDITVSVNGMMVPEQRYSTESTGAYRSEIFVEFTDQYWDKDARPQPNACRVFRPEPEGLKKGENQLTIQNTTAVPLEIERVNIGLW